MGRLTRHGCSSSKIGIDEDPALMSAVAAGPRSGAKVEMRGMSDGQKRLRTNSRQSFASLSFPFPHVVLAGFVQHDMDTAQIYNRSPRDDLPCKVHRQGGSPKDPESVVAASVSSHCQGCALCLRQSTRYVAQIQRLVQIRGHLSQWLQAWAYNRVYLDFA